MKILPKSLLAVSPVGAALTLSMLLYIATTLMMLTTTSTHNNNGVTTTTMIHAQQRGFMEPEMRMPSGDPSSMKDSEENPFLYRYMPGRDDKRGNARGQMGNPNGRPNSRMPDRMMGGGSFETRAYSSESAGGRPPPGGMNDNMNGHPGVFPENEFDHMEDENERDRDGMNSWAKTKKPGVKADTSYREKMEQFQNSPFMKQRGQQKGGKGGRSRHAEDAYPNEMGAGGGESNLRKKQAEKKKKKSKVPAKPGHANPRYGSKFHYSRASDAEMDGDGPAGSARGQHCFKKASALCSVRVMQENFAGYTKCIFDNRKRFGSDCEEWAGNQGACASDMLQKCSKQNPAATTKCLRDRNAKGDLSNACRDSNFFKSLEQGFDKFDQNYKAAGGESTFETDPGFGGDADDFMKQAHDDAKSQFKAPDMNEIKKTAREAFLKEQKEKYGREFPADFGADAGADFGGDAGAGFGGSGKGFPRGGAGQGGNGQSIPRERQLESGEKLSKVDDL